MLQRILYSFFSKGVIAVINFLILLLSARYLGVRTRGEISVFLVNIALVQVLTEIYTGYNLVHFMQKFSHRRILKTGAIIICCSSLLAGYLLPIKQQGDINGGHYFPVLLLVLFHSFFCVLLLGKQRLKFYNLISLLQPFLLLIALMVFIFIEKKFTFQSYYYAILSSFALAMPVSAYLLSKALKAEVEHSEYNLKRIVAKGIFFQAGSLILLFINRYNYFILNETEKIGLYSTACAMMDSFLLITSAASPVLLARLSILENAANLVIRILRLAVVVLIILYCCSLLIPEALILLLVGKGYEGIQSLMMTYGPSVVFQGASVLLGQYYSARGQQKELLKIYLLPFVIHLFLSPLLIVQLGISGAATASAITFSFIFLRLYLNFCKIEKLSPLSVFQNFSIASDFKVLLKKD